MTRARDVADTQDNTGGAVAPFLAGKNKIINGDFGVWQRGTSFTISPGVYSADRWSLDLGGGIPTGTISQQSFTPGTAPVNGYESPFFLRYSHSALNGATAIEFNAKIEDVRTLAGQTVTFSFWAKSSNSNTFSAFLRQSFGTGGSSIVDTSLSSGITLTTSWQRYTATATVPSVAGKTIGAGSFLRPTFVMPITASVSIDIWGVQLEAGNVATPFTTATGTIQGELAACQRYYQRPQLTTAFSIYSCGSARSTTQVDFALPLPVSMRIAPTAVDYSNVQISLPGFSGYAISALVINHANTTYVGLLATSSGLTQYRPYFLENNGVSAYIGLSAEL